MEVLLFSKKGCINCGIVKERLKQYTNVLEYDLDTLDGLVESAYYDVMATPTIVIKKDTKVVDIWRSTIPCKVDLENYFKELI